MAAHTAARPRASAGTSFLPPHRLSTSYPLLIRAIDRDFDIVLTGLRRRRAIGDGSIRSITTYRFSGSLSHFFARNLTSEYGPDHGTLNK